MRILTKYACLNRDLGYIKAVTKGPGAMVRRKVRREGIKHVCLNRDLGFKWTKK